MFDFIRCVQTQIIAALAWLYFNEIHKAQVQWWAVFAKLNTSHTDWLPMECWKSQNQSQNSSWMIHKFLEHKKAAE